MFWRKIIPAVILQIIVLVPALAQETRHFRQISRAFLSPGSKIVMIASHRGTHNEVPENSLAAFNQGIALGIDIIEMDVRHTKDDSLVIMHDGTVDRTTTGKGKVSDLTFKEIRELRLKFNDKPTGEKIPSLREALLLAKGKILVDLDIKTSHMLEIMNTVEQTGTARTVIFFLDDGREAKEVRDKNAAFRTLVRGHKSPDVDSIFTYVHAGAIHIDPSFYTSEVIANIKAHKSRIWINALGEVDRKAAGGDIEAYGELVKGGANMIQTDYPALLKQYLKRKGMYYQR